MFAAIVVETAPDGLGGSPYSPSAADGMKNKCLIREQKKGRKREEVCREKNEGKEILLLSRMTEFALLNRTGEATVVQHTVLIRILFLVPFHKEIQ